MKGGIFCCCRVGCLGLGLLLRELSHVNAEALKFGPVLNAERMSAQCWLWSN